MNRLKDYLISVPIAFLFLIAVFAFDDSFEDSKLSAQVLDEVIAQAYEDQRVINHVLIAQQRDEELK